MTIFEIGIKSRCEFSACRTYRYWLEREWDAALPKLGFCLLNPSTADEQKNDPTIERCFRRAQALGYGGLVVVNLFALRSTDPAALYSHAAPESEPMDPARNRLAVIRAGKTCDKLILGWGCHGESMGTVLVTMLRGFGVKNLYCLGTTKDGHPKHPLYLPYLADLVEFGAGA